MFRFCSFHKCRGFCGKKESHRKMALFSVWEKFRRPGVLVGPLRLVVSTGGHNLSGLRLSFRATGPWRSECLGLPLLSGPPSLCHVVWVDGKLRDDETSAPTKKLPCRGGCPHPPANPHQPLRLVATGALSTSSLPDSPQIAQPAAAAQKRSQSAAPPAPALRYGSQGSVSRNGVRGKADMEDRAAGRPSDCGVPRGSLVLSIPGKNTNRGRRPSPLPCWTPGLCYAVWLAMDHGPMRHRPLLQIRQPFVGADVPIRPL